MRRVILSTLVYISLVFCNADLRVNILTLELVQIRESFWDIAIKILDDIQRLLELLGSHLLFNHIYFDFGQSLCRVRLYRSAHVHNLFTLTLLGTLVLNFVEDFFKIGMLHQPFISALRELATAMLQTY